jgi:toxin ParE1/3/4
MPPKHVSTLQRHAYISDRNVAAAKQVVARIRLAAERLTKFPRMGREGRVPGTHEWVVRGLPYIIVYEVGTINPDEIVILGVFHAAQDRQRK